jgi:hypothetical protein
MEEIELKTPEPDKELPILRDAIETQPTQSTLLPPPASRLPSLASRL